MDELAYALGIDPVELRLRNHTPVDPRGNPWSSDGLPECLRRGAERFGWAERDPAPRARRDGDWLIGTGMAAAAYPIAFFMPEQRARARIHADGSAVVQTATQEFGTGVLTMATQVAADALGVELGGDDVPGRRHRPARTAPPRSARPARGWSAPPCTPRATALRDAARRAGGRRRRLAAARRRRRRRSTVAGGRMTSPSGPARATRYGELLARNHLADAEAIGHAGARRRSTPRTGCSPSARSSPRSPSTPSSGSSASGGWSARSRPGACSTRCSPAAS